MRSRETRDLVIVLVVVALLFWVIGLGGGRISRARASADTGPHPDAAWRAPHRGPFGANGHGCPSHLAQNGGTHHGRPGCHAPHDPRMRQAMMYTRQMDFTEAVAQYDAYLKDRPDDPHAWFGRGLCHLGLHDYSTAVGDYDQAIRLRPSDPESWNNRAWARCHTGDFPDALADVDQSLRLENGSGQAWDTRAIALAGLGRWSEAQESVNRATQLLPDDAEVRAHASQIAAHSLALR
jgi:tetratricopeptide (TPR) repeat protein